MIESIPLSTIVKPGAENAPKVWDAGDAKRVNGVEVSKNKGIERTVQLYAGVSASSKKNVLDQVGLTLNSLLTAQSATSSSQPPKSPYEAAKQEEAKRPNYTNIDA
ncbi:MAG: hypothetical protein HQ504_13790 [Rhodospirillaceae bacterium]|nr:hypothetical protein [Rhodospirillaceae bacterium]